MNLTEIKSVLKQRVLVAISAMSYSEKSTNLSLRAKTRHLLERLGDGSDDDDEKNLNQIWPKISLEIRV